MLAPYLFLAAIMTGGLILLALFGEYKFIALEPFMARECQYTKWMPTASGRNPAGEPVGREEIDAAPLQTETVEKLLVSSRLISMTPEEAQEQWGRMTSEKCFRYDMGEPLKKTRNFLQRTNNYSRTHPDSCSAPNHEFIGTFYRPHEGVGATPNTGMPLPNLNTVQSARFA
jgi:hypothetical protein